MTIKQEIRCHIIFWLLFIGLDQLLSGIIERKENDVFWSLLETFAFTTLNIVIFYLNYLWICPKTIPLKRWFLFIGGQLMLAVSFPVLRYVGEEVLIYHFTGIHNYSDDSLNIVYYFYDNSFYVFRIILISIGFYCVKFFWETSNKVSELQLEKKQAELQALKNQLSPHFLFNVLNSFYSDLFDTHPAVGGDILKLSEMLRYITYENEKDLVLVKGEIIFIEHYIDLFKRRFDGNIAVIFTYPENIGTEKIPSLLLIHFVENAFKHGILNDWDKPVTIDFNSKGDRLIFSVSNNFIISPHYEEPGIGSRNIEQRLQLMYAKNHSLETKKDDNLYSVTLNIPKL